MTIVDTEGKEVVINAARKVADPLEKSAMGEDVGDDGCGDTSIPENVDMTDREENSQAAVNLRSNGVEPMAVDSDDDFMEDEIMQGEVKGDRGDEFPMVIEDGDAVSKVRDATDAEEANERPHLNKLPEDDDTLKSLRLQYKTERPLHSMYIGKHNTPLLTTTGSNGNVQLVPDEEAAMYISCYTSKNSQTENKEALANCVQMVTKRLERQRNKQACERAKSASGTDLNDSSPESSALKGEDVSLEEETKNSSLESISTEEKRLQAKAKKEKEEFGIGLGNLHTGWKGLSRSTLVGAQLAHFYGLGYDSHMFSHKFVSATVSALSDYIEGKDVRSTITLHGQTGATTR